MPRSTLTIAPNGEIYGVTIAGGNTGCAPRIWNQRGCGTVFELTRAHSKWKKQTIHVFSGGAGGGHPTSSLVLDSAGNLYGTTICGDAVSCGDGAGAGVFFMRQKNGSSGWRENVLHIFGQKRGDSSYPGGDLTCNNGAGCGVVFQVNPMGTRSPETVLHAFEDSSGDGWLPLTAVTLDSAGNLYGTTQFGGTGSEFANGTAYRLTSPLR